MAVTANQFTGKVTICDGAWGTELDKLGREPGSCPEVWNVEKPDLVEQVARNYVDAGANIILTNTFGANKFTLAKHGYEGRVREFSKAGGQISKAAADDRALVFGSIGPSGKMVMTGEATEDELYETFKEQAEGLAEGGVDGIVVETMTETAEAVAAVKAAKTTGLFVVACMTFDSGKDKTHTMMGVTPEQAVEALTEAGADAVGCNCGIGIENYITVAGLMRATTDKPIWIKANAGLPEVDGNKIVYNMTADEFANKSKELVDAGANIVGGCCGTSPEFIAALAKTLT